MYFTGYSDRASCHTITSTSKNAFTVLMSTQRQLKLPPRVNPERVTKNSKLRLRNDILDWLDRNKLGWSLLIVESHGAGFVTLLADVMWHIDGHRKTLRD